MQVISNLVAYLLRGPITSEQLHTFECVHVICALKQYWYDKFIKCIRHRSIIAILHCFSLHEKYIN